MDGAGRRHRRHGGRLVPDPRRRGGADASAAAKLLNTATNFAALALFAYKGHVWWHLALAMALANVAGSLIGTRLALKHGAGFVRQVFIFVVLALILKTTWDTWLKA